jgi:Flp pilus assembly secretin CpaC
MDMRSPVQRSILSFLDRPARAALAACFIAWSAGNAFADNTTVDSTSAPDILTVTVDQARIVQVPSGTRTLVIGNPMIADVTLLKSDGTMIVTGKGFGETNFIALNGAGKPVLQYEIRVVLGTNSLVVQRGMERQSYSCTPRCEPAARLGDDPAYFNEVTGQIQAHNAQSMK